MEENETVRNGKKKVERWRQEERGEDRGGNSQE